MTNKFLPNTRVGIFMGFAKEAAHSTCIIYVPATKRFIYPHDTDCWFNERLSYKALQARQTVKLSRWENKTFSKHQQIEIDSSSDEDEATGATEQPDEMHGGDAEEVYALGHGIRLEILNRFINHNCSFLGGRIYR